MRYRGEVTLFEKCHFSGNALVYNVFGFGTTFFTGVTVLK
jgi:hypothetical protein